MVNRIFNAPRVLNRIKNEKTAASEVRTIIVEHTREHIYKTSNTRPYNLCPYVVISCPSSAVATIFRFISAHSHVECDAAELPVAAKIGDGAG